MLAEFIVAGLLLGIFATNGETWDFSGFYDTGRRILAGELGNIYDSSALIAGERPRATLFYTGTPLASFLYAPLAIMERPTAMVVMKVLNAVVIIVGVLVLARENRQFLVPDDGQLAKFVTRIAVAVILFQPLWATFPVGGQSTPFAFLLMALAFVAFVREQHWRVPILLVAAGMIKPAFAPLCAFIAVLGGVRTTTRVMATAAIAFVVSLGLLGWPVHQEFIRTTIEQAVSSATWVYNSSLFVARDNLTIAGLLEETGTWTAVQGAIQLALLGSMAWVTMDSNRRSGDDPSRRAMNFGTATAVGLAMLPILWEHYLQLLFIPAMSLIAVWPALSRSLRLLASAMFGTALLQNVMVTGPLQLGVQLDSGAELVTVGLLKSATLAFALVVFLFRRTDLLAAMRSSTGARPSP